MNLTKQFFLGGNATFTVESGKTGRHMTFKIRQPDERAPFLLSAMTGTDNTRHFTYMGKLDAMTGTIIPTKGTKLGTESEQWKVASWALGKVWQGQNPVGQSKIRHEGKCGCCGRKLTTPESLDRGIGPECWSRLNG
jgi:hypothetical protein